MDIQLRPWQAEDLEDLVRCADNERIACNMTDAFPHPYTEEHGRNFIAFSHNNSPENILAIVVDGRPVGAIGLHPQADIYRMNAELGYWLAEDFWGRGIVTRAIGMMVAYGFSHFEFNRIFARPFGTNLASQRALEKAGFVLEGRFEKSLFKNGVFIDELIYAVRRAS